MKVYINAGKVVRPWKHPEKYQNTTLRYSPGKEFPGEFAKRIGTPDIIRLFINLDEVWDYRTDTYRWDYLIGENPYRDDPKHYEYDWPLTVPSVTGTHELEYLQSHAACAKEVLLNIRRYEREVTDLVLPIKKYTEVAQKVVEHYKELIPNIRYIEICNEVEEHQFGGLTIPQYYALYKEVAPALKSLNEKHDYSIPLLVGGFGMACGMWHAHLWREFLELLSKDQNRVIDFYSFHEYHGNPYRIMELYNRHQEWLHQFNLPDLPLFMTEYGMRYGLGDQGRPNNLQNASGEIPGFIVGSHCKNLAIFPWCSFHNPNQQIGRTMYILNQAGKYIATPSGYVMEMFHLLGNQELESTYYNANCSLATIDNFGNIAVLMSNPEDHTETIHLRIENIPKGEYILNEYMVDSCHNNVLTDSSQNSLTSTNQTMIQQTELYRCEKVMEPTSFCLVFLKKVG